MAGGIAGGITEVLSGKKNLSKGIKAETDGNNVKIDVNIIVNYGVDYTRCNSRLFKIK